MHGLGYRQRLAGQHGLVHRAVALDHHAVGGQGFAGPHQDMVAHRQPRHRHLFLVACRPLRQPRGGGGDQLDQFLHCGAGAAARVHFEEAPGQQQKDEHGDRVVIHLAMPGKRAVDAGDEGGADAQRHRHVHAQRAALEVAPGADEKGPRRIPHHRDGEDQARPAHQQPDFVGHVGGGVGGQRIHHHLHHAEAGDGETLDRGIALALEDVVGTAGVERVGDVADVGHGLEDRRQLDAAVVPAHPRAAGGVVDLHRQHAGQPGDVALVQPDARGADDVLQDQRGLADVLRFHPHEAFLDFRQVVQPQLREFGFGLARGGGQRGAMGVIRALAAVDDGLRHRLAAAAAGLFRFAFELDGVVGAVRHRQAAVKAARKRRGVHESRRVAHGSPQTRTRISGKTGRDGGAAGVRHNLLSENSVTENPGHRVGAGLGDFDPAACGSGVNPDFFDVQVGLAILRYCDVHPASPPKRFLRRLHQQAAHYRSEWAFALTCLRIPDPGPGRECLAGGLWVPECA